MWARQLYRKIDQPMMFLKTKMELLQVCLLFIGTSAHGHHRCHSRTVHYLQSISFPRLCVFDVKPGFVSFLTTKSYFFFPPEINLSNMIVILL